MIIYLIKEEIGSGQSGHRDGSIFECQFISPQGMCKVEDTVYVVDSDTHHLRKVSFHLVQNTNDYLVVIKITRLFVAATLSWIMVGLHINQVVFNDFEY